MLLDTIQLEFARLQIHPLNLAVSAGDGCAVTPRGSLPKFLEDAEENVWA
jgi:hypothetical protein